MKKIILTLFIIFLFVQCNSSKKEKVPNTLAADSSTQQIHSQARKVATLEDSILQIRKWFNIINRNADAGNYNKNRYLIDTDSFNVDIVEFSNRKKERQKVIYKSRGENYDQPLFYDSIYLLNITREYYYWDNDLFFVFEVINTKKDSLPIRLENRFYLTNDTMIRWIKGKSMVDKNDSLFKTMQSAILSQKNQLIQPFNYYTNYKNQDKLIATHKEQLFDIFYKVVSLRHAATDSIKMLFEDNFKSKYIFEAFQESSSTSQLYMLELDDAATQWEATEKLIGTLNGDLDKVNTPGDFYYYIMDLSRNNDTLKLREIIPANGYKTNVEVKIGDVSEPQYEHNISVSRDTITFDHLGFDFTPSIFNFHVTIDAEFNHNNEASISYWGGGFSESVTIKKTSNNIFLVSHSSHDH